jgi:hypothetical protein
MTVGRSPAQEEMQSTRQLCETYLSETSPYRVLALHCHELFGDESFADLYVRNGRPSIPPRIVATVMVLQRMEGLSDREAVEHFTFDARWKYAAGCLPSEYPSFVHTVLVEFRARLRRSERPNRIFDSMLEVAKAAGFVGRKRVLDSTALYDAVATQDTVTMVRSAIRGLLRGSDEALAEAIRAVLRRDDDYASAGKPVCEWDDAAAREALVDALAKDGYAALLVLDGRKLWAEVTEAAKLLATVLGQDLEATEDGRFRIARRVAPDRVISTVDPEARHGHKTAARGFDGYKGHIAIDPDSEIITATEVTAGNAGDASAAEALLHDVLAEDTTEPRVEGAKEPERVEVYGDASYGTADLVEKLESASIDPYVKVQAPAARGDFFAQDAFDIDTKARTVTCPNGVLVQLRARKDGASHADFGTHCEACPMRAKCTDSKSGRAINVHPKHDTLHRERERQKSPEWKQRYRATRPKVERKFAHLTRRKHGGRRSRVRGRRRVAHDFALLAAVTNLLRLTKLGAWTATKGLA